MGTPVQMIEREIQCVGAGECVSRPMTEEERFKYFGEKREVQEVVKKIAPPKREELIEILAQAQGKTNSIYRAAKALAVSTTTIYNWLNDYGIQFDEDGQVIQESAIPELEEVEKIAELENSFQEIAKLDFPKPEIETEENFRPSEEFALGVMEEIAEALETAKQKAKALPCKVAYAEYDITENLCVIVDFRQELVSINDCKEFTFEEAEAAADLLTNIL